jgi:hypothetical protein
MAISTSNIGSGNVQVLISTGDKALTFMSLCNHSVSPVIINVYVVPDGAVAGTSNKFIHDLEIIAGDTFILYEGNEKLILGNNDSIVVSASVANVVSAVMSTVTI